MKRNYGLFFGFAALLIAQFSLLRRVLTTTPVSPMSRPRLQRLPMEQRLKRISRTFGAICLRIGNKVLGDIA
jgi:hypothetical protein